MAELHTLARPYAEAVFQLACDENDLPGWSEQLDLIRQVVTHKDMQALIGVPDIDRATLAELILQACGNSLGDGARNLVRLLSERRRLLIVPALVDEYERLRAERERTIDVRVRSATELSKQHREAITSALKKRLNREARLHCEVDPELIGGAVIRAGDLVIDGSVRTQLQQLAHALTQ